MPKKRTHLRVLLTNVLLLLTISISCSFQILTPDKVSYGLLPSRIWQFLLGILCFKERSLDRECLKNEKNNEIHPSNEEKYYFSCQNDLIITLLVVLTLWNPDFQRKEHLARMVSCFLVAYVIFSNCTDPGILLSNSLLVIIGDISYTMYLVHWPVIVAYKYFYNLAALSLEDSLLLIILIFVITFLIHNLFEKPIMTSSTISALLICIACVGFICATRSSYLDYFSSHNGRKIEQNDIDEIIKWNIYEYEKTIYPIPCDPDNVTVTWTGFIDNPPLRCQTYSNGSLKILIIGNSIAYRAFPVIHELFGGRYRELRLYSRSAAVPMANDPRAYPEFTIATHKVVEQMKPDIIWNIHVYNVPDYVTPFKPNNTVEDKIFRQFQENINFYSSQAKEVIVDLPYYWSGIPAAYHIAKQLYIDDYDDLEDLKIPRNIVEKQQFYHKTRLLALNCSNCRFNDVQKNFFEDDFYYLYNRKNYHAYTNDGNHLTPEMLKRIAPHYKDVIEDLLRKYQ